jgi:hypothetical protein
MENAYDGAKKKRGASMKRDEILALLRGDPLPETRKRTRVMSTSSWSSAGRSGTGKICGENRNSAGMKTWRNLPAYGAAVPDDFKDQLLGERDRC